MAGTMTPNLQVPHFSLPTSTGETLSLDLYLDKTPLVLIFIPEVKGSMRILKRFSDRLAEFGDEGCELLAVVRVPADEARQIADEQGLALPLLADTSGSMAGELNLEFASHPVVVVADKTGRIRESLLHPDAHVDGVLDMMRRLNNEG